MNLQQLRYLRETVRRDLNLTSAAAALHTSQPGLSKAIRELEDELGITIFVRHGKRLTALTDAGREAVVIADRILLEVDNLKRSAQDWHDAQSGELRIAATHTQARYSLPTAIAALRARYPDVVVRLHQGNPTQIVAMLRGGQADLGIATEAIGNQADLAAQDLFCWYHCAIAPPAHPLCRLPQVTLTDLARYDLITYDPEFAGRTQIDRAFDALRLKPRIVLEATDSDVIKTYVRLGLGVGIVTELAMRGDPAEPDLASRPLGHLFGSNVTRVAFKRGAYLRQFVYAFAALLSPRLSPAFIEGAMHGHGSDYQL